MDNWDRKTNFNCESCMFYVFKLKISNRALGRCRRYAPTTKGYPVVYSSDWCGEHKIGSNPVRDGGEKINKPEICDICKIRPAMHDSWNFKKGDTDTKRCCQCHIANEGTPADWHPECMQAYHAKKEKPDDNSKKEMTAAIYPVDFEEKAKIKAEIKKHLVDIFGIEKQFIEDLATRGDLTILHNEIIQLLEKL